MGIFISNGGVPKTPVQSVKIDYQGLVGDNQHDKKHHGGVMRAVCVLEDKILKKLQTEGHPISPTSTSPSELPSELGGDSPMTKGSQDSDFNFTQCVENYVQ